MDKDRTIDLSTEELGILSSGGTLTFAIGEEVHYIRADDLDCTTRELAEGTVAQAGELTLRYG